MTDSKDTTNTPRPTGTRASSVSPPEQAAPSVHEGDRQTLRTELARVQQELTHLRSAMYSEVDIDPEEGDVEVSERLKNISLIAMLEKREGALHDALRSIEAGDYGICNRCRQPIGAERLEARPDAKYCVKCQSEIEKSVRRRR